ncbi:MAG: DUF4339 domain-containing protein [Akkermansiaceae bacterium]
MDTEQTWLYQDSAGQQQGPVTADQLQALASSGQVSGQTHVWTEGLEEWIPAAQVDGLIRATPAPATPPPVPAQPPAQPAHQPQINLGPTRPGGLNTGPATTGTPINPYAAPKKSPIKLIIFGIIGVVVLIFAIMIAMAPSEEEKRRDIPGYAGFSDANSKVSSIGGGKIYGTDDQAKAIAKSVSQMLKEYRDQAIEKGDTDSGKFPVYCQRTVEGDQTTLVLIIKVPKIRKFTDDAKKVICEGAWIASKIASKNTGHDPAKTKLAVAVRGVALYDTIYIGKPSMTGDPDTDPLEGVDETHKDSDVLHQFFIEKE